MMYTAVTRCGPLLRALAEVLERGQSMKGIHRVARLVGWLFLYAAITAVPSYGAGMEGNLKQFTLKNGLQVMVKQDPARKVAALQIWVKVGSADETAAERGISHLIEHMAFKGTKRRGVGQIAAEVEALGGDINAYTSWDETVFHITVPSSATAQGLDILFDAVLHPTIDSGELKKEKQVVLEEILEGEDRPASKASKLLFKTAYVSAPYQYPIIGYKNTVEKFTRNDVLAFRKKWYVPENMFVVVVGDVDAAKVKSEIERLTSDLKPTGFFRPPRSVEPVQKQIRSSLIRDRNAREARLNIAYHIPAIQGNDVCALDLTADLLGGRDNSRLSQVLKKKKHLVNSISAWSLTPKDPGIMVVSATLESKNLEAATKAILEQIRLLARKAPAKEELERARIHVESQHVYSRETVGGTARSIGNFAADLGDPTYEEKYLGLNQLVSPGDISGVVQRYMVAPNITISALVPEGDIPDLTKEKLVEVVKTAGPEASAVSAGEQADNRVMTETLSNGMRVVLIEDDSNPVVSFRIAQLGGKRRQAVRRQGE